MPPRYLLHSALIHLSLLAFLAWAPWFRSAPPVLWIDSFDFMGPGGGGGGGGNSGPKKAQMGQVVPQPVKVPIPNKAQPVQHAVKGEEAWKIKDAVSKPTVKEDPAAEPLERGEKSQKETSNIVRRGVPDGAVAGDGSFDFGSGPGVGPGIGIGYGPGTGGGFGFGSYLRIVRERLWMEWSQSAVYGSKLSCVVGLTVLTNGSVKEIKIEKSSSNAFYDNVALRAVRNAAPLPPLPPNFPAAEQRFNVQFRLQD